jgi:hypothetical protein
MTNVEVYAHSVSEHFAVAVLQNINDRDNLRLLGEVLLLRCGYQRPQLVDVDGWSPVLVPGQVVVAHTDFTEVTRMVLIEVCSAGVLVTVLRARAQTYRWWCIPPARPRPPGCLRCFPTRP